MYHAAKLQLAYSPCVKNPRPQGKAKVARWHAVFACFVVVLLAIYLFLTQSIARDRFLLFGMESRIAKLQGENTALEVKSLEKQSLSNLKIEGMEFQLEEVKNISYIQPKLKNPFVLGN